MRSIIETGDPEECSVLGSEDNSPDNYADILFPAESPSPNVEELQPEPGTVFRLWQLFLDRVNPLSKVIHVPSLQPYVMEGATNICNLSLSYQALLFAIYTMAVVSMSETECLQILSMSREQALRRFGTGAKLCFVRFNILKNHDMAVLQALVLYLVRLHLLLPLSLPPFHLMPHSLPPLTQKRSTLYRAALTATPFGSSAV